jgi:hypothetical protein
MKRILSLLLVVPLGLLLTSCSTASPSDATPLAESMKGYELYSWQEDNQWQFSLLIGTNREKTLDEIKSNAATLPNVEVLISTLEKIPSGQYVTWSSRETLAFPTDDIVEQVEQVCKDQGLILNIAR